MSTPTLGGVRRVTANAEDHVGRLLSGRRRQGPIIGANGCSLRECSAVENERAVLT
jgi:hypothetical protein